MPNSDQDRVIALAALLQASSLVRRMAHTGQTDSIELETCINSVFRIDANSAEEIYGDSSRLRSGLQLLAQQLRHPQDLEITRYSIALMVLARKVSRKPDLLRRIREGIESTAAKLQYFPSTHENIVASLAEVYTSTVSTLVPRIMVNGDRNYLSQQENADRIRALLLAGIRAAVLWRQSGGGRLTLLLRRKPLLHEAQRLLAIANSP